MVTFYTGQSVEKPLLYTYKSATKRTVSVDKTMDIDSTIGVTVEQPTEVLDQLVREGFLVRTPPLEVKEND